MFLMDSAESSSGYWEGITLLVVFAGFWVVCMVLAGWVARTKGRSVAGWVLAAAFLNWIAIVVLGALPSKKTSGDTSSATMVQQSFPMYRECPHCKEQVRRDASLCPHCRLSVEPWSLRDGYWWRQDESGSWLYLDESTGSPVWVHYRATSDDEPPPAAEATTTSDALTPS